MLVNVVGEFLQFVGGNPQSLRRVLPHGGHDFVVEIFDQLRRFLFDALGRLAHFAVEIIHASRSLRCSPPDFVIISRCCPGVNEGYNLFTFMNNVARLAPAQLAGFRQLLLSWYSCNKRDLPWRYTRDPYRVWVSEVMLQQTRVAAVIERYAQFLDQFPTVEKLSEAREAAVLAAWSGLGYYRRARNLYAAARIIVRRKQGVFPPDSASWRELPGIGRYTAAAIASIAFNEPTAVLDGNVERVLRRLFGGEASKGNLWTTAQFLMDPQTPGDFNQAMMELGAILCVPSQPQCSLCPIRRFCRSRGRGEVRSRKAPQQKRSVVYCLAMRANSVCLVRRRTNARVMPGMWELPEAASRKPSDEVLFSLAHSITVTNFKVLVVRRQLRRKRSWIRVSRVKSMPLTGLARKILRTAKVIE